MLTIEIFGNIRKKGKAETIKENYGKCTQIMSSAQ
jgi:hypothetical protein